MSTSLDDDMINPKDSSSAKQKREEKRLAVEQMERKLAERVPKSLRESVHARTGRPARERP